MTLLQVPHGPLKARSFCKRNDTARDRAKIQPDDLVLVGESNGRRRRSDRPPKLIAHLAPTSLTEASSPDLDARGNGKRDLVMLLGRVGVNLSEKRCLSIPCQATCMTATPPPLTVWSATPDLDAAVGHSCL
jgi:hypothetical protein